MVDNQRITRTKGQKVQTSEIDQLIGMRIGVARKIVGKKQEDLAQYLGLTLQQTQKYESGKNKISIGILLKVAEYFGISVTYLLPEQVDALSNNTQELAKKLKQTLSNSYEGDTGVQAVIQEVRLFQTNIINQLNNLTNNTILKTNQ
jgi:transcriptional regulator with XRE-family HTH domain